MHRNSLIVRAKYVAVLPKYALGCSLECGRQRQTQTELYFNFCRGKFMRPGVVMSTVVLSSYGCTLESRTFWEIALRGTKNVRRRMDIISKNRTQRKRSDFGEKTTTKSTSSSKTSRNPYHFIEFNSLEAINAD